MKIYIVLLSLITIFLSCDSGNSHLNVKSSEIISGNLTDLNCDVIQEQILENLTRKTPYLENGVCKQELTDYQCIRGQLEPGSSIIVDVNLSQCSFGCCHTEDGQNISHGEYTYRTDFNFDIAEGKCYESQYKSTCNDGTFGTEELLEGFPKEVLSNECKHLYCSTDDGGIILDGESTSDIAYSYDSDLNKCKKTTIVKTCNEEIISVEEEIAHLDDLEICNAKQCSGPNSMTLNHGQVYINEILDQENCLKNKTSQLCLDGVLQGAISLPQEPIPTGECKTVKYYTSTDSNVVDEQFNVIIGIDNSGSMKDHQDKLATIINNLNPVFSKKNIKFHLYILNHLSHFTDTEQIDNNPGWSRDYPLKKQLLESNNALTRDMDPSQVASVLGNVSSTINNLVPDAGIFEERGLCWLSKVLENKGANGILDEANKSNNNSLVILLSDENNSTTNCLEKLSLVYDGSYDYIMRYNQGHIKYTWEDDFGEQRLWNIRFNEKVNVDKVIYTNYSQAVDYSDTDFKTCNDGVIEHVKYIVYEQGKWPALKDGNGGVRLPVKCEIRQIPTYLWANDLIHENDVNYCDDWSASGITDVSSISEWFLQKNPNLSLVPGTCLRAKDRRYEYDYLWNNHVAHGGFDSITNYVKSRKEALFNPGKFFFMPFITKETSGCNTHSIGSAYVKFEEELAGEAKSFDICNPGAVYQEAIRGYFNQFTNGQKPIYEFNLQANGVIKDLIFKKNGVEVTSYPNPSVGLFTLTTSGSVTTLTILDQAIINSLDSGAYDEVGLKVTY